MIEQYLTNKNENTTVPKTKKNGTKQGLDWIMGFATILDDVILCLFVFSEFIFFAPILICDILKILKLCFFSFLPNKIVALASMG